MEWIDKVMSWWEQLCKRAEPAVKRMKYYAKELKLAFRTIWDFVTRMKKVVLAAPVAFAAVILAIQNLIRLPRLVGLFLQETGEYSFQIIRELAVLGPMAITAICLLLMFFSKRTLTPWLVSVFSLMVPVVILLTNTFQS